MRRLHDSRCQISLLIILFHIIPKGQHLEILLVLLLLLCSSRLVRSPAAITLAAYAKQPLHSKQSKQGDVCRPSRKHELTAVVAAQVQPIRGLLVTEVPLQVQRYEAPDLRSPPSFCNDHGYWQSGYTPFSARPWLYSKFLRPSWPDA